MYFYKDDFSLDFNNKEKDNHKNGRTKGEKLSKTDNYPIKKCPNCGMYFIQNSR